MNRSVLIETLRKNPIRAIAFILVAAVILAAVLGPAAAPHDPLKVEFSQRLAPPSADYIMGTDAMGRCLFSRILAGSRTSIGIGLLVVICSSLIGLVVGLISGYMGGIVDECLMRVVDVFLALPEIIAAMTLAGLLGAGWGHLVFALSITGWMRYARLVRGITLSVRQREYVTFARFSGVPQVVVILRHILPSSIPALIVLATLGLAKSIIAVSALGFLGFGVQPPIPEWGTLLMEGKDYILSAPHLCIFPGLAIMLTVLGFNLLGDSFHDITNSVSD